MKKLILLFALLFVVVNSNAQLTGITPSQGLNGQTLQTTITGNGIFIQSSSPSGNLFQIRMIDGSNVISVFDYFSGWMGNTIVNDPNTVTTEITIPIQSPPGDYDLEVITGDFIDPSSNQTTYTLPDAFAVLPPDGYVTGTVYTDTNGNGVLDVGETGISNYLVKLMPINYIEYTDANGNYSFPAANGNYTVTALYSSGNVMFHTLGNDTLSVTINNSNSVANNFGLEPALISITPATCYKGIATLHQIVANRPIFQPGINPYGNVTSFRVYSSPNVNINASSITVIDSFTIQVLITIPANVSPGTNLDIRLYTNPGFVGYHFLNDQFEIATPPYFISGTAFFDQNQNKINDVTEPKINLAKFNLAPDNTSMFTNTAGEFIFGSLGGPQTLSYLNNIPGITIFTDSVTYTFNTSSNLAGKDFGFISTLPDYSIDVKDLYLFARCNTSQNATFKIKNTSNTTYDVVVWLKPSSNLNYIYSPIAPSSISNDTIYWTISNILPYTEMNMSALLGIPGFGSVVDLNAGAITYDSGGAPQLTDQSSQNYGVFCAYDPNDKQVSPPGILAENFTLMGDTLEYLIRFQNTGNDTAFNVVVLDTLDSNLDFSTFDVLASSHSMQTELKNNGAVKFSFINILLVDSVANEPESHGYIRYRINGQPGLLDSTEITNTAYIYFDFNPAIVTNTTLNTLVFVLPVGLNELENKDNVLIYPNPFDESATMTFDNSTSDKYSLIISDITGKKVSTEKFTTGTRFTIEGNKLSKGMYFYNLFNTRTKTNSVGKFVVN